VLKDVKDGELVRESDMGSYEEASGREITSSAPTSNPSTT